MVLETNRKYFKLLLVENFTPKKHKIKYSKGSDDPFSLAERPEAIELSKPF